MTLSDAIRGIFAKKHYAYYADADESRPIKVIRDGYNSWRIVYADAHEHESN
ncbi:MAG: hypothetical protein ACP5RF_00465 [Candidatus Micrarchaeia archaeon]